MKKVTVFVYGAEQVCPSCVSLPSSKETASWLEAALKRKYGEQVDVCYVDIHQPVGEAEAAFAKRVIEEDLWYPVVVIEGEVVAEGNPKLKVISQLLENMGAVQKV
ncbi:YuzD family protein [Laceyella putida]|uniref:YuzD family protein n=1 Tax=Laceyella putida TaxID=110101 RepID=A0ABW2RFB2_9BACL